MIQTLRHPIKNIYSTLTLLTIVGACFLFLYYKIDGIYMNQPIVHFYDTQNIPLEKTEYREGEMVRMKVSFCKTRETSAVTQWALVDGRITFFEKKGSRGLPIGCYPEKGTTLIDIHAIPKDMYYIGEKLHFEGVTVSTISGGREIRKSYRTQEFTIIK